jgi:hypothetical protein
MMAVFVAIAGGCWRLLAVQWQCGGSAVVVAAAVAMEAVAAAVVRSGLPGLLCLACFTIAGIFLLQMPAHILKYWSLRKPSQK